MKIAGLNKTTLLDFPGRVAATIFTYGCNFVCPFCYNRDLVLEDSANPEFLTEKEVLDFLIKRKKVLTGVCISGGEPTIQPGLPDFIHKIKEIGYFTKLDTNGYKPDLIKHLLDEKLLDYIAMDVKGTGAKYPVKCGLKEMEIDKIDRSIAIIKQSGIEHEFRTTIVKELHTIDDLITIGKWLESNNWYLQPFEDNDNVIKRGYPSYSRTELSEIKNALFEQNCQVNVRAIDNYTT